MTDLYIDDYSIPGGYCIEDLYVKHEGYLELLKKDLWTVKQSALYLSHFNTYAEPTIRESSFFHLEVEEKLDLLSLSVMSGSIEITAYKDQVAYLRPVHVLGWAVSKEIMLPPTFQDWYNKQICNSTQEINSATQATPNKSDLTESERKSMLKMIIGMAIDAYGYDPEDTRSKLTGDKNGLSAKLSTHGIDLDADTIRKHLKAAKNHL